MCIQTIHNPRLLSESIFIRPNQVYADSTRNLTRKHLKSLRNFKITNIQYETIKDNNKQLDVNIFLTPLDKFSLDLETELTHSNIRDLGVSGKFSFINRNIFRGAEIFKLSFLSSFFNASQDANKEGSFFNSWEIGADMSLEIPRFVAPFGLGKLVPKRMSPRTMFTLGTSIQQNIGLDRETVTALIDYKWQYNNKKTIQLDVFNTQYVRNLRIGNYFDIYNSEYIKLNSIAKIFFDDPNYTLERQGETVSFMKTVFNDEEFQTSNPDQYRNNLNILDRYNIITSDFLIPTIAYSYTFNNQSDFRDNGGSNDIRAWQTYDLGPGSRNSGLEYNIGSLKFLTSAEYRFDLFGSLKGALFMDAGNIWDITNSIFAEEKATFNGFKSIKDIAVGSGFGLRYDFSFLVFRLDLGFKMHEPYLENNKWFRNYNFSNAVYNIGINYPF